MSVCLLGRKIGMTQIFNSNGHAIPVTLLKVNSSFVTQLKTDETDGYSAVQIGIEDVKEKHSNKALMGHFKKAKVTPKRYLKEFRVVEDEIKNYEIGSEIKLDVFSEGDRIDVSGISKGRGYAGVMKRHNFKGSRASHGQGGEYHRHGGSIGQCSYPARVFKGMKMPGHYGAATVTVQNLKIVQIDLDQDLLLVKGAIPGPNGSLISIKKAIKD